MFDDSILPIYIYSKYFNFLRLSIHRTLKVTN